MNLVAILLEPILPEDKGRAPTFHNRNHIIALLFESFDQREGGPHPKAAAGADDPAEILYLRGLSQGSGDVSHALAHLQGGELGCAGSQDIE
jgi:hypothetical protein